MDNLPTRNNNPGDLEFRGQQGATQDTSSRFASFQSPQEGYGALLNDVQSKINRNPNQTIADFANTWAPPTDNNNTAQYAANLANHMGVAPNTTLSSLQPKIGQFAEAIGNNEGYKNINSNPNPSSQEVANHRMTPQTMPSFDKQLLGILGIGAAGLGIGALTGGLGDIPLLAGGLAEGGIGARALSLAKKAIGSKIGQIAEGVGLGGVGEKLFGSKTPDTSGAISGAGDEQAKATQQASEQQQIEQEALADEQQTQKQIQQAESLGSALNQSLQTTPTGKTLASLPETQDTLKYMAQHGYAPDTSSGVNNFSQADQKANAHLHELSQGSEKVLDLEGEKGSIDNAIKIADRNIEKYQPEHEWAASKKHVREFAHSLESAYGNGTGYVPLGKMEKSRRGHGVSMGDWKKEGVTRGAHKAFYMGLRETITDKTNHKDLYNRVKKEETKIFAAKKLMKKMHSKKALEHKGFYRGLLKHYGKYIGTALGDKIGGPLGAVVGTMVGDHLVKAVDKRFGKTYFESKEGQKLIEILAHKSPKIAKTLENTLERYGVQIKEKELQDAITKAHQEWQKQKGVETVKQLPAGDASKVAIPLGGKTYPQQPAQVLQAKKGLLGQNPKTGKFMTTYTSSGTPIQKPAKRKKSVRSKK